MRSNIAIVGMACQYPDAGSPTELWENVLAQRRAFRQMPSERLNLDDYFSPDPAAPDKIYMSQAAVLEGYEFDRVRFRVAGTTFRSADMTHWLALDIAARALADAGFPGGNGLAREMTGVILGNTLTGEFSRASLMRLRWPYVRRVIDAALVEQEWSLEQRGNFLGKLETQYKAPFAPIGEESLAGGLSNTIAGRICNHFDFKGGGFTMDGACASSLLAVGNACAALTIGDLDVALAGGVDLSLDPFELIGFAKTSALAPEKMRVYDERSAGFWPGEGCGFVVLMRYEDAVAQKRRIYAQIRGWGISSDGGGGITRPEVDGQILALNRAYDRAGFGVETVPYFEGHGTGTAVGDTTELRTLSTARRAAISNASAPDVPPAVIGSVKGNFGHTKAAAGVAGLIKATMALHTQVLPPNTGCENPHPELTTGKPVLRVLSEGQPWPADQPLRASVSAMGFGGINAHIVLEGAASVGSSTETTVAATNGRRGSLGMRERMLLSSAQDSELFLFGARDIATLQQQIEHLQSYVDRLSLAELTDLATQMQRMLEPGHVRAAVVAATPAELMQRLATLHEWLTDGVTTRLNVRLGVFIGAGSKVPRIGYLFPGQGTPSYLDGGALRRRFPFVSELYTQADLPQNTLSGTSINGTATAVAQPAIVTASLAALRVLDRLDIRASVAVGHSLGELTALQWAGVLDETALVRTATIRGKAMMDLGDPTGSMASIRAGHEMVTELLNGEQVSIACLNGPSQTVISGAATEVATVVARAQTHGLTASNLPVSHAFHSPLVAAAAAPLAAHLSAIEFHPLQRNVVSTITGQTLCLDDDLRDLLCRQVTDPVQFTQAVTTAAADIDLFIEVGPGQVLSTLASDSIDIPTVAIDAGGASLLGLLRATAAAYVLGAPVNHDALFADRFARPFNLDWQPSFLVNPCELAPTLNGLEAPVVIRPSLPADPDTEDDAINVEVVVGEGTVDEILALVRQLIADRVELPLAAVHEKDRLLSDLHLNSITVSQIVAEAARQLGITAPVAPTEFANVTVLSVAEMLEEMAQNSAGASLQEESPAGVDSWIRSFSVEWVEKPLQRTPKTSRQLVMGTGVWQIIAPSDYPLADELHQAFNAVAKNGVLVCLPAEPDERYLYLLLDGVRAVLDAKEEGAEAAQLPHFVLVQQGWGGSALARTLHLEEPDVTTCVVDVPLDHPQAAAWVAAEALAADGHSEARYDHDGTRWEPVMHLQLLDDEASELPLTMDDVLLVTGGGKGITAECALSLARKTGVRLALLGRSQPETDEELAANLERMSAAGVDFHYFASDVTLPDAVLATVRDVEATLGPVTAILHGAARNVPQRLRTLDEETLQRTFAPKVLGARNLLAAIDPAQLKLFVSFGSIIARTGLPGEADYGLANEWLRHLTEDLERSHPNCRCLTVDWSVWAGAGMGERLGTLDALVHQGIMPIPLDEGIAMLHRLLAQDRQNLPSSVVVAGRFGSPPTLQIEEREIPFLRFLERVRVHYPGVELVVDTTLSAETDPYLLDHLFMGDRLFPAVLGLEAMAQAAMALAETDELPVFEDVELQRPVVVPEGAMATIRVVALMRESGRIEVALRTAETGFLADHFRATCTFGTRSVDKPELISKIDEFPLLHLDPQKEMYGGILFQGGRFQRLQDYREVAAHHCLAEVSGDDNVVWFDRTLPPALILGDPGVRDVTMHAIQACMPQVTLLPIGVDRLVPGREISSGSRYVCACERLGESTAETLVYDVFVTDERGCVYEQWQGLRLKVMRGTEYKGRWAAPVLGSYLQRRLKEFMPLSRVAVAIVRDAVVRDLSGERRARSDLTMQRALGKRVAIQRRPDGRPEVGDDWVVSAAHAYELTLAVAGPSEDGALGCDVEPVAQRDETVWQDLLGAERFALAKLIVGETGDDLDSAATRVWTAAECLKKAGVALNAALTLDFAHEDGWVLLSSGIHRIAILATEVWDIQDKLVFSVLMDEKRSDHAALL